MFKKIICLLVVMMMLSNVLVVEANDIDMESGILIEATSKQVLYQKDANKRLYPASTTKIMTMILLFEAINNHEIAWNDKLTCSSYASSMGGSQVYLEKNEVMSVEELFKCIAIASANDACVMLGEGIAGDIKSFVSMMNDKAKELELVNTHFENCTGLHHSNHYSCARDLAMMASYLLEIGGDKLLSVTSLYDSYIRERAKEKFWLVNTNKLLKQYKGIDGLKTGYTKKAGYCMVSTCKRNGMRLIGVLMKEKTPKERNEKMKDLLDYGYSNYVKKSIYHKDEVIDRLEINDLFLQKIEVVCRDNIYCINNRKDNYKLVKKIKYDNLSLPIDYHKGIGKLLLYRGNEVIGSYDVYSRHSVDKLGLIDKVKRIFMMMY